MNFFEHFDKKMMEMASVVTRDVLNQKAVDFLITQPNILRALVVLRQVGKFEISQREADLLVKLGIMQTDDQGYFLSEIIEDLIDTIIDKAEKLKREELDAPK